MFNNSISEQIIIRLARKAGIIYLPKSTYGIIKKGIYDKLQDIINNLDKIVQGAVNNSLSFAVEQQKNYLHNYQAPRNNQAPPANGATLNQSDKQIVDGLYDVLST